MTNHKLTSHKSGPLKGHARVPGDKSISHRAVMLGSITIGETIVSGLLEGEDVMSTAAAMRAMGAKIHKSGDGLWHIYGTGLGGLHEPSEPLDMGNSGTSARLLMGLVGGHNITATFTGDASLSKRPMKRVITPLEMMGVTFAAREGGLLPITLKGTEKTLSIEYELPVASAQVKSSIILAGLSAYGTTTVIERIPTRDHSENMLRHFGIEVGIEELANNGQAIHINGHQELKPCAVDVPSDPSSAAFPTVAALLTEGSDITLPNIGINDRRIGLYKTLIEMGADITFENQRIQAGEKVADLRIKSTGKLKGIKVPPDRVPSMIDEFPVLAVAASCAEGTTYMTNLAELRVKESDRLKVMADGLAACGVKLEMGEESLTIHGIGKPPAGGAKIATHLDHRIAMSFLVLGTATDQPVSIDDASPILTSFPNFIELMNDLGTQILDPEAESREALDLSNEIVTRLI